MKKPSFTKSLIALLLFFSPIYLFSQSDVCSAPTSISSASTCTNVTGANYSKQKSSLHLMLLLVPGELAGVEFMVYFRSPKRPTYSIKFDRSEFKRKRGRRHSFASIEWQLFLRRLRP